MRLSVITTCSNRKKCEADPKLKISRLKKGSQEEVAKEWCRRRTDTRPVARVDGLYCGRGFQEAKITAQIGGGGMWVVSAGLGLVHFEKRVPAYDLTISKGSTNSLQNRLSDSNYCPKEWWNSINSRNNSTPIRNLVVKHPKQLFLLMLSRSYLELLESDLLSLTDAEMKRIRIVGPPISAIDPERLINVYMPYDGRLDSLGPPYQGTKGDFSQRAGRHFAEVIWIHNKTVNANNHRKLIEKQLSKLKFRKAPKRQRIDDDEEIKSIIRKHWHEVDGKSGRMLRFFRDHLMIACEQKRLSTLFNQVKQEGVK